MRIYVFILFTTLSICAMAQSITKNCISALEQIKNGYIQNGVKELQKLSNTNSLEAQFFLAVCYEEGIGVHQDKNKAFSLFRKTAERGLPDAMRHLSSFYREGIIVSKDESRSEEWLERFQKKGGKCLLPDLLAIYNEGLKYSDNYALNPNESIKGENLINSNNTIGSNNQTVTNITIVQAAPIQEPDQAQEPPQPIKQKSDVDQDVPITTSKNENTFALIIANENYQEVAKVSNALNDGDVFAEYCEKTIGLPKTNVHLVKDATLNNIKREINLISQIANAYDGEAKFIIYYAGHGIPDEATSSAYLLPVDGYGSDLSTCYSLNDLYHTIGKLPSSQVVVFLDACFSGSLRGDGMLASARGVAIKAKTATPQGNMVILSAAQGDETAYPYNEQNHGLFTYFLLKKLKETQGNVTLEDLAIFVKENVMRKSLVVNGKQQTPTINYAVSLAESWKDWYLK